MKFSRVLSSVTAAGLLFSPIAAQAGTRATGGVYPVDSGSRAATVVKDDDDEATILLILLALIPIIYGLIKLLEDKSNSSNGLIKHLEVKSNGS